VIGKKSLAAEISGGGSEGCGGGVFGVGCTDRDG
jgi:hypothetical protein